MEQYNVTGMTCAACQARVEKVVSKVPGVTSVSVNLLTNSMGVEGTALSTDIVAAVEKAGYHASVKGTRKRVVRERIYGRYRNTKAIKEINYFSYLFNATFVFFYGPYDVELAIAGVF